MQRSYNNHTFKVGLKNPQSELLKTECEEERVETGWGCGDKGRSLQQRAQEGSCWKPVHRLGEQFLSGFHAGSIPNSCSESTLGPFSLHPTALCSNFCSPLTFSELVCEHRLLCSSFNPQNTPKICVTVIEPGGPKPGDLTLSLQFNGFVEF